MTTPADFYVGRGAHATWIGSTPFDGSPLDVRAIADSTEEAGYRAAVAAHLAANAGMLPAAGWPWRYPLSHGTEWVYALDGGAVYASRLGREWFRVDYDAVAFGEPQDAPKMTRFAHPLRGGV